MAAVREGEPGLGGSEERSERTERTQRPQSPGTPPIRPAELPRHRGRFLVWDPRAARALRERHRVWGALVGAPARRGRAAAAKGARLPLELRPEEARALRESGGEADDEDEEEETPADPSRPSPRSERRSRVFRALWGRGHHVTAGGKFGGDFLVYPGPPPLFHACAVALCPGGSRALPLGALLAAARLGTSVRKSLLLCGAAPPGGALRLTAITWRADLA